MKLIRARTVQPAELVGPKTEKENRTMNRVAKKVVVVPSPTGDIHGYLDAEYNAEQLAAYGAWARRHEQRVEASELAKALDAAAVKESKARAS